MALTKVIGAGAEGLTLSSTNLTIANGLTLTDGNVTLASGHGIDFSATGNISGTSSEIFDDYEEGTWTPTHGGNTSYHARHGAYIKVGKKVFVRGQVHVNAIGTGSAANMSGLPFTAATTTNGSPAGTNNVSYYSELAIAVIFIAGYVPSGTTNIYTIANVTANATIQYNTGNFFADSTRLDFSMTYETA